MSSELELCIKDLKVSMSALKEAFISCSCRDEIYKNQTQSLVLRVAGLECKLNF